MKGKISFGVSPAYFISKFTNRFSTEQVISALPEIKQAGFVYWQPEVFHEELLNDFLENSDKLAFISDTLGLQTRVFAGHFLLHYFKDDNSLAAPLQELSLIRLVEVLKNFSGLEIFSVPIPPYLDAESRYSKSEQDQMVLQKLLDLEKICAKANLQLALEIMPNSLLSDSKRMNEFLCYPKCKDIGILFDSGHFNAMQYDLPLLVKHLGRKIIATHLSDNYSTHNDSWIPGKGEINWKKLLKAFTEWTDLPCLTLEIISFSDNTLNEYNEGLNFLQNL
jgi:sugar phosphate isomerase/epimerase